MTTETLKQSPDLLPDTSDAAHGRDEMNLAEFPLGVLGDRVPQGVVSLVFRDRVRHPKMGEWVDRQFTISPAAKYGLPTAADDEVILGCIQLTKLANAFTDSTVKFTRYQLVKILRWPLQGWSYRRIEAALNRWVGVTLYYENAWWDREKDTWVDEKFHLLDNVTIPRGASQPWSITWNRVMFRSFHADNLKRLDLDFYFSLKHAGSKRAFRYLDKKFYRRRRWELRLREFACEHVGLSRHYDTGQLKGKLKTFLAELEARDFLKPLSVRERYLKIGRGDWRIVLIKKERPPQGVASMAGTTSGLAQELTARGVTAATAAELVSGYSPEQILVKLEVFDWLVQQKDKRVSTNPAGYLVKSIHDDYQPPTGFLPKAERQQLDHERSLRQQWQAQAERRRRTEEIARRRAERALIDAYLATLSAQERARLETEALAGASGAPGKARTSTGKLAEASRQYLIDRYVKRLLTAPS